MSRVMKNSGVAWIGEIPEKWDIGRTKSRYSHHKIVAGEQADEYERLALTLNGVIKRPKDDSTGLQPEAFNSYQILKPNELVFKLIDLANVATSRVGYSPYLGLVSPAYIILEPHTEGESRYGVYYFLSMWQREIFNHLGDDGVRSSLNAGDLLNIPYLLVPPKEQSRIAAYLDHRCAEIDRIMDQTRATIEEYKKLKQSIITEAVTHGVRGERKMKASGVEWIGKIPEEWNIFRIANVYDERNESGSEDLPILLVSINTGISDHEVADDEQARTFVRIEDRTKYKRVYPGDLAYNMMRAWQGAFGAARVDGMVSPAYVVAKPKKNVMIDSRYMEALLRSPSAIDEMHRYSHGITDFRLRLYWPEFKSIQICIPPYEEQNEIADFIDQKGTEIDSLIESKQQLLIQLEAYKKSVIYEYVTGKREVPVCQ